MKRRGRVLTTVEPVREVWMAENFACRKECDALTEHFAEHFAEHERLLTLAADRIEMADRLLARITELHSHDNLTGCCLTCGRAGPCKTTRILTGESR